MTDLVIDFLPRRYWPKKERDTEIVETLFPRQDRKRLLLSAKRLDPARWLETSCRWRWWNQLPSIRHVDCGLLSLDPKFKAYRWVHRRQIVAQDVRGYDALGPDVRCLAASQLPRETWWHDEAVATELMTVWFLGREEDGISDRIPADAEPPGGGEIDRRPVSDTVRQYAVFKMREYDAQQSAYALGLVENPKKPGQFVTKNEAIRIRAGVL